MEKRSRDRDRDGKMGAAPHSQQQPQNQNLNRPSSGRPLPPPPPLPHPHPHPQSRAPPPPLPARPRFEPVDREKVSLIVILFFFLPIIYCNLYSCRLVLNCRLVLCCSGFSLRYAPDFLYYALFFIYVLLLRAELYNRTLLTKKKEQNFIN